MREPLTLRMLGGLAVSAVLELVLVFGVDVPSGLENALVGVIAVAGIVYAVVTGRLKVTPLSDPRDADGANLVRADGKALTRG